MRFWELPGPPDRSGCSLRKRFFDRYRKQRNFRVLPTIHSECYEELSRQRLFAHFPDGGKRRRSSSNQFSSIVTCRSTLTSLGSSCGSHAMMRLPSGVRSKRRFIPFAPWRRSRTPLGAVPGIVKICLSVHSRDFKTLKESPSAV